MSGPKKAAFLCLALLTSLVGCAGERLSAYTANGAPVAVATAVGEVEVGALVEVDGSASHDPDKDALTYSWLLFTPEGSAATLTGARAVRASFVPDVVGEYQLTLVVHDGIDASEPTDITITAVAAPAPNEPPVAVATAPVNNLVGEPVLLDGTASYDPDDDDLSYLWKIEKQPVGVADVLSDATSATAKFTPTAVGQYLVSLEVSDGELFSELALVTVVASEPVNSAPVANAGGNRNVTTQTMVMLDASASYDDDGDPLSYSWRLTARPEQSTTVLVGGGDITAAFLADEDGVYEVELTVDDGRETSTDVVQITATTGNSPPNAHAGSNQNAIVGQQIELDGTGSNDPDGDPLSYRWRITSQPIDSNVQLSSPLTARPRFTPHAAGTYVIELVVNDGQADSDPASVTVTVTRPNGVPVADAGPDGTGRALQPVVLDATQSFDPDGDALQFAWAFAFKPANSSAVIQQAQQAIAQFIPDVPGTYTARVTVSDGLASATDTATFIVAASWPAAHGDVVVSEVMADPKVLNDEIGEWFELYNPTTTTWDLQGCVLSDEGIDSTMITEQLLIAPSAYATLARTANPGFAPTYVYGNGFSLSNSEDEIIVTCGATEIASMKYEAKPLAGVSLTLKRSALNEVDNDDAANWCHSTTDYNGDFGTPNAQSEFIDCD